MTTFHTISIDGLDIFDREAGSRDNPTILLLRGFPTSSHMFRNLNAVKVLSGEQTSPSCKSRQISV